MSYASEDPGNPRDFTQCTGSSSITQHRSLQIPYLVVIQQNGQIIKTFQPQEKHITIGRSSKSSITLPDPRLSREAAEIILGPVPLLRRKNKVKNKSDFNAIHPGKPYHFRPYTLTLLEQGGIIFNRKKPDGWKKKVLLGSTLLAIIFLGTGSTFSRYQSEMINNKNIISQIPKYSKTIISSHTQGPEVVPEVLETITPDKIPVTTIFQPKKTIRKKLSLNDNDLDKTITTAVLFVQKGKLKTAGRILTPLIPHADIDQRKKIIDALDPHIQALFEKAYTLQFYEPGPSKEIMQNIAESGFEMLPSCQKAMRYLDSERRSMEGMKGMGTN